MAALYCEMINTDTTSLFIKSWRDISPSAINHYLLFWLIEAGDFKCHNFINTFINDGKLLSSAIKIRRHSSFVILHYSNQKKMNYGAINIDPETMGGTPVFTGTRVPIQSLFDYIETGETLDEFLENFPTVRKEHAIQVLEMAKDFDDRKNPA